MKEVATAGWDMQIATGKYETSLSMLRQLLARSCRVLIDSGVLSKQKLLIIMYTSTGGWGQALQLSLTGNPTATTSDGLHRDYCTWPRNVFNHCCLTSLKRFTTKQFSNTQVFKELLYHHFWTSFLHCCEDSETRCWKPTLLKVARYLLGAYRNLFIDLDLIPMDHQTSISPFASKNKRGRSRRRES